MAEFHLRIVSGAVIDGAPRAPGFVALGVAEKLARQLLERGKAVLATDAEVEIAGGAPIAEPGDDAEVEAKKPGKPRKAAEKPAADGGKPEGGE